MSLLLVWEEKGVEWERRRSRESGKKCFLLVILLTCFRALRVLEFISCSVEHREHQLFHQNDAIRALHFLLLVIRFNKEAFELILLENGHLYLFSCDEEWPSLLSDSYEEEHS